MAKWIIKAMAQGALSLVPESEMCKCYLQQKVIKTVKLTAPEFAYKLGLAQRHFSNYLQANGRTDSFGVLELGTGYYPVLPIGLWLCGASRVCSVDKLPLVTTRRAAETIAMFRDFARDGRLRNLLPHARAERVQSLTTATRLEQVGLELLVTDARRLPIESGSIDFFFSNVVLRDIPEPVLLDIFREFQRVAARAAVMSHYITLEDHFADYDRAISVYNFLQYSDAVWKLVNPSLHYQNRLRISDYRRIHERAGFTVLAEDNQTGSREQFDRLRLAQRFREYPREDLMVSRSWMVSTAAAAQPEFASL